MGACCLPATDQCTNTFDEDACLGLGGLWQGPGTNCIDTDCLNVFCSCCDYDANQCITGLTVAQCRNLPGNTGAQAPVGCTVDVDCSDSEAVDCCRPTIGCSTFPNAAACEAAGGCVVGPDTGCFSGPGGNQINCDTDIPMSCCTPDGDCFPFASAVECITIGGTPKCPAGCLDVDCTLEEIGACCLPNGNCVLRTEEDCGFAFGDWQGGGTTCENNPCGSPPVPGCRAALDPFYLDGDKRLTVDICALAMIGFAVDPDHDGQRVSGLFMPCTIHETRSTDPTIFSGDQCRYHKAYLMIKPSGRMVLALCSKHNSRTVVNVGGFGQQPDGVDDPNGRLRQGQWVGLCATENPRHGEVSLHSQVVYCGPSQ